MQTIHYAIAIFKPKRTDTYRHTLFYPFANKMWFECDICESKTNGKPYITVSQKEGLKLWLCHDCVLYDLKTMLCYREEPRNWYICDASHAAQTATDI